MGRLGDYGADPKGKVRVGWSIKRGTIIGLKAVGVMLTGRNPFKYIAKHAVEDLAENIVKEARRRSQEDDY